MSATHEKCHGCPWFEWEDNEIGWCILEPPIKCPRWDQEEQITKFFDAGYIKDNSLRRSKNAM